MIVVKTSVRVLAVENLPVPEAVLVVNDRVQSAAAIVSAVSGRVPTGVATALEEIASVETRLVETVLLTAQAAVLAVAQRAGPAAADLASEAAPPVLSPPVVSGVPMAKTAVLPVRGVSGSPVQRDGLIAVAMPPVALSGVGLVPRVARS
ncbi:hypothetical protein [Synechococcus sp. A10-1-5-1]|uniref:hypothetical protein n=1 Tax=Synechococcus sp. A10-1-5-1 TaxID=2936507 RepID=UPI0035302DAD